MAKKRKNERRSSADRHGDNDNDRKRGRSKDEYDNSRDQEDAKLLHRRTRSRSRSPDEDRKPSESGAKNGDDNHEEIRRARMARLRQEIQNEDQEDAVQIQRQQEQALKQQLEAQRPKPNQDIIEVNQEELEGLDEEEKMKRLLGFSGGFGSTKGEAVEDNQKSAARGVASKNKARKYRQYMNRKNGFNRPLEQMD